MRSASVAPGCPQIQQVRPSTANMAALALRAGRVVWSLSPGMAPPNVAHPRGGLCPPGGGGWSCLLRLALTFGVGLGALCPTSDTLLTGTLTHLAELRLIGHA
jgi:hypothetical protein